MYKAVTAFTDPAGSFCGVVDLILTWFCSKTFTFPLVYRMKVILFRGSIFGSILSIFFS